MNKTAICIMMLEVLNSRGILKTNELADILDTNPRNISEYIKELQIAGYDIESIKGKNGGYYLNKKELFPVLRLTEEEKRLLDETNNYLLHRPDFINKKAYTLLASKISSSVNNLEQVKEVTIFDRFPLSIDTKVLEELYDKINNAIKNSVKIEVGYFSSNNREHTHILHPYKTFIYNNTWFLLAWNETVNDMGYFKLNRMNEVKVLNDKFTILRTYQESDYLDKFGMKQNGDYHHIVLDFYKLYIAISERVYGKNQVVKRIDKDITRLECDMQNEDMITSFVLGFGDKVKVIEPEWLKERIIDVAKKIIENGN